ncbi:PIN2/TERF1-interacting telomerase inhibitor 1-like [Ptychodera flava]|uniref:PIN2/TERF1-interacting telomerase inhibitor 1-like n=1 Tax=Ptychodera flava TaxID=63121 RepID=UPI00396A0437
MAMLAESKNRQKWSTDPRNTLWANDSDKFGQRMLQKMGWKPGRGLGANQHGRTEHVKIVKKDDNLGLGANHRSEDNWLANQDDFNSLLAQLNQTYGNDTTEKKESSNADTTSLEEISKRSKKRVHYKKFTRGKDLSVYSKKDLACIIGTKTDSPPVTFSAVTNGQSSTPITETTDIADKDTQDESSGSGSSTPTHGIVTVTSSQSLQEYFSQKMAALKRKQNSSRNEPDINSSVDPIDGRNSSGEMNEDNSDDCIWMGQKIDELERCSDVKKEKKKKKKKKKKEIVDTEMSSKDQDKSDPGYKNEDKNVEKKKKKSSKRKLDNSSDDLNNDNITDTSSQSVQEDTSRKKRKKQKLRTLELDNNSLTETHDVISTDKASARKKNSDADICISVKKGKKKKIKENKKEMSDCEKIQIDQDKSDSEKTSSDMKEDSFQGEVQGILKKKKKSKKRKRSKDEDLENETCIAKKHVSEIKHKIKDIRDSSEGKTKTKKKKHKS